MKCIGVPFLVLLSVMICSCSSRKDDHADEQQEWKEMDDFHMVMADVYHPLKDSNNLAPIKSRSEELAASAERWAAAELPEKVNNDDMRGLLQKLKDGTSDLSAKIRDGADDPTITTQLTDLHGLFHHVQEAWYGGGEHGQH